ncbi:hypothetical protein LTR66_010306, partial [Elasticomyces elasticus]
LGDEVRGEEGIAYADLDLNECVQPKQFHDVVGGYQRLDVFDIKIDRRRREPATFLDAMENEGSGSSAERDGRQDVAPLSRYERS